MIDPTRLAVTDLLRHPGQRETIRRTIEIESVRAPVAGAETAGPVALDVVVESRTTGVDLTGVLEVPWTAPCRRCLEPVAGTTTIDVEEHFDHRPVSGDIGPIGDDGMIDLGPMIHDETRCALPLTVLCGSDCRGPIPDAFVDPDDPEASAEVPDPRWSALDEFSFED